MNDFPATFFQQNFKQNGPWKDLSVDILVPFYNEVKNIDKTHQMSLKLEEFFNIKNFIYIDNGSSDGTGEALSLLGKNNPKVKVVTVKTNQGYGAGIKQGLKTVTSDFILTNHADAQFDSYQFFNSNLSALEKLENPRPIFPVRMNRPKVDAFVSSVLCIIARLFLLRKISDFNGHPKLIPSKVAKEKIESLPDNFSLDMALYLRFDFKDILTLPVQQSSRLFGVSSWNSVPFARVKQLKPWFKFLWSQSVYRKLFSKLS